VSVRGFVLAGIYVAVVAALAAVSWSSPDAAFNGTEAAALVLTIPAVIVGLPVLYVVGAAAWNLTDADQGGPMWPVTVVYAAMFAAIAVANVWLVRLAARRLRRRHAAVAPLAPAAPNGGAADDDAPAPRV
jgi:hypothetical protein